MPTRTGLPALVDAVPYPGAPRCFQRLWNPEPDPRPHVHTMLGPLMIYGYACRSSYEEDWSVEDGAWRRGSFPSVCFSELEPDGEYGFTELAAVQEIPEADLRAHAAELGMLL